MRSRRTGRNLKRRRNNITERGAEKNEEDKQIKSRRRGEKKDHKVEEKDEARRGSRI